ncbi:hypothetical protein G6O69_14045 [Pseudenhygromyxa sp. WMMC2535]|uniref:hypothetical protein n=1 Tax=Pseudenhygromyxa sp. WMMC2535 TaxID=2712867 RepID=UPI001554E0D6|nr:hypothetical protein [Pseudenhygromyxa sp. WMMC2535]NVB38959.1 hypothetical protein [Pseudenhygromyxa sp. WMMC2535]
MQRLRRLLPHLVGLAMAGLLLWGGGAQLERRAHSPATEAFSLRVDAPARVIALPEAGAGEDKDAREDPAEQPSWRARVGPPSDRARLELRLDGVDVGEQLRVDEGAGEVALDLGGILDEPGWHFVEAAVERRGGRRSAALDPVLVGRFGAPARPPSDKSRTRRATRCDLALRASPALVESLLVAMLERELLPELRAVEHLGPDTQLRTAKLELRDDALRFELEIAGVNTLAVSGVIAVWIDKAGGLQARLVTLGEVDFRGRLRNQARGVGAGGGALIGGAIAPPLAPLGALAGLLLADRAVTNKARALVREQVDAGLERIAGLALLPPEVALIPERDDSRVALGFCALTRVQAEGVVAGLWIEPVVPEGEPRFDLGVSGPLITGARLSDEPLGPGEDLRLELSVDVVNALVFRWTQSGLLAQTLGEAEALDQANVALREWTALRLDGLRPTRPLVLAPGPAGAQGEGAQELGWRFGVGGLAVDLHLDQSAELPDADARWGQLQVAARGSLRPTWDPQRGELGLAGSLDELALTCAREEPRGGGWRLEDCFSELLEAADLRARLDAQLRPGAEGLPTLALREVLADSLALRLDALALARPRPGVLRLSAALTPEK